MKRNFDDVLLGSIELFCLAAEAGSFTAAAHTAGVTPAAVSRSVSRLEKRLGVRLFVRSTRNIRLTEGGRTYFEQCRAALQQLVEAEREVTGEQVKPSGTIGISTPTPHRHRDCMSAESAGPLFFRVTNEVRGSPRHPDGRIRLRAKPCAHARSAREPVRRTKKSASSVNRMRHLALWRAESLQV